MAGGKVLESFYRPARGVLPSMLVTSPDLARDILAGLGETQENFLQGYGYWIDPDYMPYLEASGILPPETVQHFRQAMQDNQGHGVHVMTAHDNLPFAVLRQTRLHEVLHTLQHKYALPPGVEGNLYNSITSDPSLGPAWSRFSQEMHQFGYDDPWSELLPRLASGQYRTTMTDEVAEEMFIRYAEAVRQSNGGDAAVELYNAAPNMRRAFQRREGAPVGSRLTGFRDNGDPTFTPTNSAPPPHDPTSP